MTIQANHALLRPVAILTASLVLLAACSDAKNASPAPAAPPAVTVMPVQPQAVPMVTELPGRTAAYQIAELRPQVTGIIKERPFKEGSEVEAGQVLYVIDASTYQADYDSTQAELRRVQTEARLAEIKAARYADLLQQKFISKQAYDEVAAAAHQSRAEVENAAAAARRAKIDVGYAHVKSPIAGRIGRSTVTPGALVTANQVEALATVQQLDPIYVDLTQSSVEMLRLRKAYDSGRLQKSADDTVPVKLLLEDGSAYASEGRMEFSEVSVDQNTGSVTFRAVFPNPDGELLPGMYVRAQLTQGVRDGAMLIPHAALSRDPRGNAQVMVVNGSDEVEVRPVKVAESQDESWVITDGLTAGDRVIVEGLQRARPGTKVQPQEAGAAAGNPPSDAGAAPAKS